LNNPLVAPHTKLEENADPNDPESYARFELEEYAPALMLKEALGFIERNKDRPFFLYYPSPIPHNPLQAPRRWVDYYKEKLGPEEPYLADKGYFPHQSPRAAYAAMVSYLDEQVGQIVKTLQQYGLSENTLVLFNSDNGPTYGGGADSPFFESARPFKCEYGYGKGFVHEGGIRVPMIAKWPGRIQPGTETDHISAFWDLLPTFCEVAGTSAPEGIDGISFLPAVTGIGTQAQHEFLYWEFPSYTGQQAVRMGEWKGIRKGIFEGNLQIELYNLKTDIQEQNNLASNHPDIVTQIEKIMKQERTPPVVERFKFKELGD
jgi:arylsulfatase